MPSLPPASCTDVLLLATVEPHSFGFVDWGILALYACSLLGIGFYFSRQRQSEEEYFLGGRSTRPWLAGISLFTALTSIITYLGTPGEYIQYGPVLVFLPNLIVLPFVQWIVARYLIPEFMRLPITSAYELLEVRLGSAVRKLGSGVYIVTRLVWMALILSACATVMVQVAGCEPHWNPVIVVVIAAITTTYTLVGGLRTVMITEAVQFFMLLLGALLTLVTITYRLGGVSSWWPSHWEMHWPHQPLASLDPHVRVSVLGALLFQLVGTVSAVGSDQAAIQRFLSTRDAKAASRAFFLNNIAVVGVTCVLGLVGAALLAFYRNNPEAIPANLTLAGNGDAFFPLYISQFLPVGISGIVMASLMAMGMSCLAAGINALITILTRDFLHSGGPVAPGRERRRTTFLAVGIGAAVTLGTLGIGLVRGDIYDVAGKTVTLLSAPLFTLFFLALFMRSATSFGALVGTAYGSTAAILIAYWDAFTGQAALSFLWVGPVSLVISLGGGWLFSQVPTKGAPRRKMVAYSVLSLGPLVVAVVALLRLAH